jgi:predicted ATPase
VSLGSTLPIRAIGLRPGASPPPGRWPAGIPAIRAILEQGLELGPATVLVGENGSGKSTVVEAIAGLLGIPNGGGSNQGVFPVRPSESPLPEVLRLERNAGAPRWAYFLRSETMHALYTYLEQLPDPRDTDLHERSHGEGFLTILERKFDGRGVYLLDEPESALSFAGCLALVGHLHAIVARGAQVILATHSPVVASLPGARILELGEWGLRETPWEDTALVANHTAFLTSPERFLRHVIDEGQRPGMDR